MNKEPAILIGAFVSIVVALGAIFNVVIDGSTLSQVLVSVVPIVTGILVRFKVYAPANVPVVPATPPSGQVGGTTPLP